MLYAGIDNGKKGAIAAINENQEIVLLKEMPLISFNGKTEYDIGELYKIFNSLPDDRKFICIEKCYTMPLNGAKANFTNGEQYGIVKGILTTLEISYEIVGPKIWQTNIFQGDTVKDTKEASVAFCKRKWPSINLRIGNSKKDSDGYADALNLALYCWRRNNKNE